ncbi:hypothetical protein HYH02_011349 [Chlamydomonas schloesseri]|uniref:Peptidyl-prolyl cis-trans isomerase n=1 Tax=Chlamydomonas schloesseri TaxID=2026947 RepID=A0A835TFZ6_9CHLO|nr:hypothetical protein HYH02_011349 [Chlamydomonas schloesseri]|eukprot:KAG2437090.1 hypothetical protein HYH02_011349 [Chlamydomonas schloesseri]
MAPFSSSTRSSSARPAAASASSGDRVVHVAHILLPADAEAKAKELEDKLAGGAAFEELAREHSSCGSAKKGGELGWLSRGTFFPQFEAAAFAAPVGGITRATTGRGLHLIKVLAEKFQATIQQMDPQELYDTIHNPALLEDVQLVDVREDWEFSTSRIPGFKLMPLSRFSEWSPDISSRLDPSKETVVLCHHGVRSMQMAQFLVSEGFTNVKNVVGGIDNYSRVDSSIPLY